MHRSKILMAAVLLIGIVFSGFQCASTELTSAKLYIQQKNYDKALEALKKEVAKNPKSDEGYYLLGVVYGEKGEIPEMADAFKSSLAASKQYEKQINEAKKYHWANLFNRGVGYYQKANNATNKDSGKVFFNKSKDAFQNAIMLEPDSADTYKNLAFVFMSTQEYDEAIAPLKKIIEKDKSLDGYRYLGEIYYDKASKLKSKYETSKDVQDSVQSIDYYNKAIDVLQAGRKDYPSNSDLLLLLSNSYIGANKIDVAIDAFKAGVEQDPGNKYYHYNYGVLLLGAKDFEKASVQFHKALDIDSTYENAVYNLAVTYVRWGTELNKEATDKGVDDDSYKQKYEQALPYLEKSVKLKSTEANVWELLGRVYTVLNMKDKATNAFNEADKLRK